MLYSFCIWVERRRPSALIPPFLSFLFSRYLNFVCQAFSKHFSLLSTLHSPNTDSDMFIHCFVIFEDLISIL